jgi:EAL domain-containing protein (putative c-di-GMP-specific phosphodiesterase class I)
VVAEGIENEEEASVLKRNNVELAQGFFYARTAALVKM